MPLADDETTCPDCAETIKKAAKVCKHCGYRVTSSTSPPLPAPETIPEQIKELTCSGCNRPRSPEAKFCRRCGTIFKDGTSPPNSPKSPVTTPAILPEQGESRIFSNDLSSEAKWGCSAIMIAAGLSLLFLISQCQASNEAEAKKEAVAEQQRATEARAEEAENRKKGFHCLSGWDGSFAPLVEAVKARLRDPDSFEHVETVVTPADNAGIHTAAMKYRAKNGFGGLNVEHAAATYRNRDCSAVRITTN